MYEKMLMEYSNSSGSAMAENEVRMGSWETKINQLRNAINSFYNDIINTDFVKGIIGGITLLINNFGNLKTILGIIFTLLAVNKGTAFLTFLKNFSLSTMLLNSSLVQTQARLAGVEFAQMRLMTTTQMLTFATKGLWAVMLANPIGLVVGAVTAVIMAFDFMGARAERSAQKQKEAFDELNRGINSLKQQTAEAKNLASQYESLSAISSRTTDEETKLEDIRSRLITQFPDLIDGYDAEGKAILGSSESIQQAIKDNEELLKIKQEQMAIAFTTDGKTNFSQLQKDQERLDLLTKHKEEYLKTIEDINNGSQNKIDEYGNDSLAIAKNNLKGIKDELSTLSTKVLESRKDLSVLAEAFLQSSDSAKSLGKEAVTKLIYDLSKLKDESKITGEEFTKIFDGLKNSDFSSELSKAKTELEKLAKSGASKDVIGNTYEKAISYLSPYLKALGISGEEAGKILKDMLNLPNATEASNKINNVTTSLKSLQKTLSDSSSAITEIQSALDEYAENKAFSLDTLVKLADKHESLIGILGDEKAVHQELTNIIEQEQEKSRQAYIVMLNGSEDFYNKNIEGIQKFVAGLDGAREVDLSGAKSLAEAKLKVENELMKNLAGMWSQYYDAQGNMTKANIIDGGRTIVGQDGKETYITPEMRAQLKAYYDASSAVKKKFDDIAMSGTKSIDFSKLGMSKSDSKKKEEKPLSIESTTQALINQIQQEYLLQKAKSDSIQKDLSQAQSQKDYAKTLELTNSLIASQIKETELLSTARSKINQAKDSAISSASSQFGDVSERWFTGNDNQESVAYIEEKNKASEETRKIMEETFKTLQLLRNAWMSNKSAMDENAESSKQIQSTILDINYSIATQSLESYSSSIDSISDSLSLLKSEQSQYDQQSTQYSDNQKQQIELLKQKSEAIQSEIDHLQILIATTNLTANAQEELKSTITSLYSSLSSTKSETLSIYNSIADSIISTMKRAYEKQKDIAIKSIEDEMEKEDSRHEKKLENLDKEMQRYQDAYDAKIKLIDDEANAEDYNSNLTSAQKEAQDVRNKINILIPDDSIEAQFKREQLEKELADKIIEIEKMQKDHSRDLRKDALSDQLDDYKTDMDAKKDSEDAKYKSIKDSLNKQKTDTEYMYNELINDERKYASMRLAIINGNTDAIKSKLSSFLSDFGSMNKSTTRELGESWNDLLDLIDEVKSASESVKDVKGNSSSSSSSSSSKINVYGASEDISNAKAIGGTSKFNYITIPLGSSASQAKSGDLVLGGKVAVTGAGSGERIGGVTASDTAELFRKRIASLDTGGQTPDFVGGKLAVLHGSEIINTKFDSLNLLKAMDISKNIINTFKFPDFSNIKLNSSQQQTMEFNFDNLIHVQGDVTKDSLPTLKDIAKYTINELNKTFNRSGILRGV